MDDQNVALMISSGDGPGECQQAVAQVLNRLSEEANEAGIDVDISLVKGRYGPKSAIVVLHGHGATALARRWVGTIQWICKSALRPANRRQNWFIGVFKVDTVTKGASTLDPAQVRFETFRAGGPGGQHQNTTDSAVRATCLVTGTSAVSRGERSQHRNKALALERLSAVLQQRQDIAKASVAQKQNVLHHQLERGNPVRVFRGEQFKEII